MINPRPFIKKVAAKVSPPFNKGGDGRYIAVLCANAQKLDVYDRDLFTSGNYGGSGSWTSTPLVASITLASPYAFSAICYRPINKSIYVFGNVRIERIDLDPSSGTFCTSVENFAIAAMGGIVTGVDYDPYNDVFFIGHLLNGIFLFNPKTRISTNMTSFFSPLQTGRNHQIKFINALKSFCTVDSSTGPIFKSINPKYPIDSKSIKTIQGWDNHGSGGFFTDDRSNIYYNGSGTLRVIRMRDFVSLASVTQTNSRLTIPSWSENNNRIFTGSMATNALSFLEIASLSNGGNISKGSTETNETGSRIVHCTGDIALVLPMSTSNSSTNFTYIHVFSTSGTPAYIGYIVGSAQGNFTTHSYGSNWITSNRIKL